MKNNCIDNDKIWLCISQALNLPLDEVKALPKGASLIDIGLDSLRFIQLIVLFEDAFDITVNDSDLMVKNFETIDMVYKMLGKYIIAIEDITIKKCIITDCDNVLWDGIAAEDGIENIKITDKHICFQRVLLELYKKGVLICLCSKNDVGLIQDVFAFRKDMIISFDNITLAKVNWDNKVDNIKSIANELNLSIDSFVFVDDSDYEIGLVRSLLPQVAVIKANYTDLTFINHISSFFTDINTKESFNRTEQYHQQKEREKQKLYCNTVEEYNESLQTQKTIFLATQEDAERICELSHRTNQFNLSLKQYNKKEISALINDENHSVICLNVKDIYGDMGLIAAFIIAYNNDTAIIDSFWLSCRAFGRGFEDYIIDNIKEYVKKRGIKHIKGVYHETSKNLRYKEFYLNNGVDIVG